MADEESNQTRDVAGKSIKTSLFDELGENAKSRDLFDVYDNTALGHHDRTIFEGYFRTLICMLIQILAPPWVIIYTIQVILTGDSESEHPINLCNGLNKPWTFAVFFSKLLAALFVFYITITINKGLVRLKNKPTYRMFELGIRYKVLKGYQWSILGIITNFICSILCLIAGLAIIFNENTASGIVLNALAIFFLIDIDNNVLTYDEAQEMDFSDKSSVPYNTGKFLKYLCAFSFAFVRIFFFTGPLYIFLCKEGFGVF